MNTNNFPLGINNNPLTNNLWCQESSEEIISPGNQNFISTESFITIATEDGIGLVTET